MGDFLPASARELYRSPNGDLWLLVRDDTGRVFVRHKANLASGGTVTDSEIADILCQDGFGPEKQELLRLGVLLLGSQEAEEWQEWDPDEYERQLPAAQQPPAPAAG